jgi:hypothetical protein
MDRIKIEDKCSERMHFISPRFQPWANENGSYIEMVLTIFSKPFD